MKLQTLESCYRKRYGESFQKEKEITLLKFLEQAPDIFILTQAASQWYVHMKAPKPCSQTQESNESFETTPQSNSTDTGTNKSAKKGPKQDQNTSNVHPLTRPKLAFKEEREHTPNKCSEFKDFLEFVKHFREGRNLLLISKMDYKKHVDSLANINWCCVFDFDVNSRENGLFSRVEDVFRRNWSVLYPRTWTEPPNIPKIGTEWCFISGVTDEPESKTPDEFKMWYPHIKSKFEKHINQIINMLDTVELLTVVAFWPDDTVTGMKFQKIISVLNESISPPPKVVVVGNPSDVDSTLIKMISPDYFLTEKFEHVYHDLATNLGPQQQPEAFKYRLPTDDGCNNTQIDDIKAASFRENMDILYLDNPYPNSFDLSASEEEEKLFFKGGTLSWQLYYKNGPKHFYAPRDLFSTIKQDISVNFIAKSEPGCIKVFHAPGAGGTTLGQNLIWKLHKITPCIQIRTESFAKPGDISQNISDLYKETHCPIVVLCDETDDNTFQQIQQQVNHDIVVFIHLKRVSEIKGDLGKNEYFLKGHLSPEEACRIGPTFLRHCNDDIRKKDQLQTLVDEVKKGINHHLIEFGLVIHLEEFRGVTSYVSEYLKDGKTRSELSKAQRVLGYLSLVHFFGEGIMPCQMFGTVLGKSADYKLTYEGFPSIIKEFTVPVGSGSNSNKMRICHFLIAGEILEQLLSKHSVERFGSDLSHLAKSHLHTFVLEFINDLKSRQEQIHHKSKTVLNIVIQTFIYREEADDTQQRKRRFSRLIESIPSEPPFFERLQVIETLADSFPSSPLLWAHLGRAYSLLCPTKHKKTEQYFEKAIACCQAGEVQFDSGTDDHNVELSFVYHMYGMFYLRQIQANISNCRKTHHSEMEFQRAVVTILTLAKLACEAFSECRRCGVAGSRESLGCTGDMNVRLCICELLKSHYKFGTTKDLHESSKNSQITDYVVESITQIQQLIMKCFNIVDFSRIHREFNRNVARYQALFSGMSPPNYIDTITIPESFDTRYQKIAGIKLKYGKGDMFGTVSDIKEERDIKQALSLIEQNIEDIKRSSKHSNMDIDFSFLDWIYAIRHPQQRKFYSLEDVLTNVRFWNERLKSPYSHFYLLVLLFAVALDPNKPFDKEILKQAMDIKKEAIDVKKIGKQVNTPFHPREWLGKEHGIRCLIQGYTFDSNIDRMTHTDEERSFVLAVFKGTIKPPNNLRQYGSIKMSVEGNVNVPFHVSFCPFKTNEKLIGEKYAGSRVEFVLAFTLRSGLNAYNVKLLKKSTCKTCGEKVEIVSVQKYEICTCKNKVENQFAFSKQTLNERSYEHGDLDEYQ
ncbi:sterile alpha motif domain-containing protein 9-like [Ylistrum balloti]|uniref:sterile alpha motif domain-containing protein 9-like n=1 Tax=Ylistrum balloti TaxID=509963 RepID=UPI002905C1F0|nr:sterile alpha motif domain-containing protein 9-like [Ylistrum balloti]